MARRRRLVVGAVGALALVGAGVLGAQLLGEEGDQVVWVLGDACLARDTPINCGDVGEVIAADDERDAVLVPGDAQYVTGTLEEYTEWYDKRLGSGPGLKEITYPVPGNHDYETGEADGYFAYFEERAGDPAKGYYSVTLGDWRIVAANSNCSHVNGCGEKSDQGQFIREALDGSERCELLFAHDTAFSDGPHGDTEEGHHLFSIAYDGHAELYVSGHDHSYQRFGPKDPDGSDDPDGVQSFVVGTGGSDLTDWRSSTQRSEFRQNTEFGALRLVLGEDGWSSRFISVEGKVLDTASGGCRS